MGYPIRTIAATLALIGAAGATVATPAIAREKKAEEAKGGKLTPAVVKALGPSTKPGEQAEIQKEIAAKNFAAAKARLVEAEAVPNRTPDDNYTIAIFKIQIAQSSNDFALLKEAIDQAEASGKTPPEQHAQFVRVLAGLAVNANDFPTAQKYYEQMAVASPGDASILTDLAKIYLRTKQIPLANQTLQKAVAAAEAKGAKADSDLYGLRLQIALDNHLAADVDPAALALVRAYPSAKTWEAAVYAFRQNRKLDEQVDLDAYRLQRATGAMTGEGQYLDYAQTAQLRGLPGEARAVLAEGIAKKVVSPAKASYQEIARAVPAAKIAADRASLPASERQARAAANGKLASATADGYFGHGDYSKAAETYRLALSKGGVDAARVNTRLGIALGMSGDKAGAEAAFKAVTGEPRAMLAQYWLAWLAQKA